MSDIVKSFSENKLCRWCKTEGLILFEYIKTTKKKRQYKGKCPNCGKTNMRYLREGAAPPGEPEPPQDQDQAQDQDQDQESAAPPGEPVMTEVVKEIIKAEEVPAGSPEEEEEEEEKDKKPFPIGLTICVAIIIILVILNVWVFTQYQEKKKENEAYGNTKNELDRDR